MNNLFSSLILVAITLSIWVLPNVYPVTAGIVVAILAAYSGDINVSSVIILILLAVIGNQYSHSNEDKNALLRINIVLLALWALWSKDHQGHLISWTNYVQLAAQNHGITIQITFEKIIAAILLGAFLLGTEHNIRNLKSILSGKWMVYLLSYIVLLIPVSIILYLFAGLNIGAKSLSGLLATVFLLSFTEEIIYRQLLQNWLHQIVKIKSEAVASWLPILVVSVMYGAFHIQSGINFAILYFFVGAAYGYIYQKSGKIEVAILVHFALRLTFGLILTFGGYELALLI
jgi:membrane protease YdiL (CAAX protease family)